MNTTIRRYESVDQSRTSELIQKVEEGLLPKVSELPGFHGYSLIDSGDGVMTSVGFFDTAEQADDPPASPRAGCAMSSSRRRCRRRR